MTYDDFDILSPENQRLVHGALKKYGIYPHSQQYEDYLQLARLTLLEAYQIFQAGNHPNSRLNVFIYQRICWKLTDALRKEQRRQSRMARSTDEQLQQLAEKQTISEAASIEYQLFIETVLPHLTAAERHYLIDVFLYDLSVVEIARKRQVSRSTVYKWRNRLALKYLKFFQN